MNAPYQICNRCIMDTSDPEIQFDENGVCEHCTQALARLNEQLLPLAARKEALNSLVRLIKHEGEGKEYDCIIGVSGGVDSTMVAYMVRKHGLRPLAVHFDNGWDSELAVDNIRRTLQALNIDLHTHVVNWEEFKDLQLSFLKASVANCEAPTDHGITALLFHMTKKIGCRFILSGSNLVTEAIMPISWGHYNQDLRHLKALHKRYGRMKLKTMPTISIVEYIYYVFLRGVRQIPFLNYIEYNRETAKELLAKELGWRDYGAKHFESVWTRYFQGCYLPRKFGYDKRRAHLSTLICSGLITRDQALNEMEKPIYEENLLRQDTEFVMKKFGLSKQQYECIINAAAKKATEYPSNYFLFHKMRRYKNYFRKVATNAY